MLDDMLDYNIRGIPGINEAIVLKEKMHLYDASDKSIHEKERYVILTESYNLRDIMRQ